MAKQIYQQSLKQSSVSHDPSQKTFLHISNASSCAAYNFVETMMCFFFPGLKKKNIYLEEKTFVTLYMA